MPDGIILSPIARRKRRVACIADLLCGAGGSSTGAKRALERLGYEMDLVCVNHWDVAIETHSKNHPEARHYCQDIAAVRPIEICPEGYLDLLMASPTCTHHSRARGAKPTSDQKRSDPWHIITWLTELRVKRILIENVPEFVDWGPVDRRTMRPVKSRKGEYFRSWIATLQGLGFKVEWKVLNAADFGDATTRERFFLLGRSDGKRITWPIPTHARNPDLFGAQKWRPAREIIDWSNPGKSIFNRKKPLSPKTLARIYAGAAKFNWPEPFLVILRQHMAAQSCDVPLPTITAGGTHIGLAQPIIFPLNQGKERLRGHRSVDDPLCTVTATGTDLGLVEPVVEPFVLSQASGGAPRRVAEPLPTIPTDGAHALIAPYYGSGSGETCKSVDAPLDTVTTKSATSRGVVLPITHSCGGNRARSVDDALPTITCANRGELALAQPVDEDLGYDIRFRMLEPEELAAAMGFDAGEVPYQFAGTKTERIKQIGNAVPVRTACALVSALMGE